VGGTGLNNSKRMLFTVILEFEGTNSVAQFAASGPSDAFLKWIEGLEKPGGYGLNKHQVKTLTEAIAATRKLNRDVNEALGINEDELTPLDGMNNVWCLTGNADGKFVLLNIVATVS
jgi:hypothetical protein